ncbi:PREDICTED: uncharacterized protein LOC106821445 [Priapulus caudatus]|uniref:Uncharacterized protein LOC106821445 n=1 Tax=Priapulus caudatus TaxID=37621 RepID=A0ABM1FBC1_PRICU|nr:PREDICTED: uncharacterized protein LOC106821445 [Priapulus caudatus]
MLIVNITRFLNNLRMLSSQLSNFTPVLVLSVKSQQAGKHYVNYLLTACIVAVATITLTADAAPLASTAAAKSTGKNDVTSPTSEQPQPRSARSIRLHYWQHPCGLDVTADASKSVETQHMKVVRRAVVALEMAASLETDLVIHRWSESFPPTVADDSLPWLPTPPVDVDEAYLDAAYDQFFIEQPKMYEHLQIFAVNFDQIYVDELKLAADGKVDPTFTDEYSSLKMELKWLLCNIRVDMVMMGHKENLPAVTEAVMPDEARDMSNLSERDFRDYITIRDYVKLLEYVSALYATAATSSQK